MSMIASATPSSPMAGISPRPAKISSTCSWIRLRLARISCSVSAIRPMILLLAEFQGRFIPEPERVSHRVQEDLSNVVALHDSLGPDFEKALGHVSEGCLLDVPELQPFEVLGHLGDDSLDSLDVLDADHGSSTLKRSITLTVEPTRVKTMCPSC